MINALSHRPPKKIENELSNSNSSIKTTIFRRRAWGTRRRLMQRRHALLSRPWRFARGPKTQAGKQRASHNALKNGAYDARVKFTRTALRRQRHYLQQMRKGINPPNGWAVIRALLCAAVMWDEDNLKQSP